MKFATKPQKALLIVLSSIALAILVAFLVLLFSGVIASSPYISLAFVVINPLIVGFAMAIIANIKHRADAFKEALRENVHGLGYDSYFYNYSLFEEAVKKLQKKNKGATNRAIIAFTATNYITSSNISKNSLVRELNKQISMKLGKIFDYGRKNAAYCYYQNMFVLYVFKTSEEIEELVGILRKEIYEIATSKDIKIFVQPYFGVAEDTGNNLLNALDNAVFARMYAESNYEDLTYYAPSLRKEASLEEIDEIREAIHNNEFEVYYQPKFSLKEKMFVSSEALVRWNSPKYGLLSPARFIEKAELGGLIHEIDLYVFKAVCKKLREDKQANRRLLPVSVNFSLYEFYNPNFIKDVFKIIDEHNLNPNLIEIEITETTSQSNTFMAASILKKIKEYGLKISMDDFGSGFSSLSNLNKMPFDIVKIDQSLINGIVSNQKTFETVKLIIQLCKANGMSVVAEGVDSQEKVDLLKKVKCDICQGYYYAQPLSKSDYIEFLKENSFEPKEVRG